MIVRWFKAWSLKRAAKKAVTKTAATKTLRVHLRVFFPTRYKVATMLDNARSMLKPADIEIAEQSYAKVTDGTRLQVVEFKRKSDMDEIKKRENVSDDREVVVYFVNATIDPYNGASTRGSYKPWIIVTTSTSEWTLAHEIGHVLGLDDTKDSTDRLMTAAGTHSITNRPPDLNAYEIETIKKSKLLF